MTPGPRFGPLVGHNACDASLRDEAGGLVEVVIPLDPAALIRLVAQASAASLALSDHARRACRVAPVNDDISTDPPCATV